MNLCVKWDLVIYLSPCPLWLCVSNSFAFLVFLIDYDCRFSVYINMSLFDAYNLVMSNFFENVSKPKHHPLCPIWTAESRIIDLSLSALSGSVFQLFLWGAPSPLGNVAPLQNNCKSKSYVTSSFETTVSSFNDSSNTRLTSSASMRRSIVVDSVWISVICVKIFSIS